MACAAKPRYRFNITCYVQLSEFGYCLHNVLKDERRDYSLRLSPDFPGRDCPRMTHARRVPYEVATQPMQDKSRPHFYHGSKQSNAAIM
jgi:hypothetical protein